MTKAWFSSFSEPRPYWRDCIILSLAVGATAVTFGVFADAAGFDLPRIVVMSALVFTGASQFAAVGVIDDGGTGGAAVGSALLLAARNALYGPVVRPVLPPSAPARLGAAHFVIDETTAMTVAQTNPPERLGRLLVHGHHLVADLESGAGALLGAVLGRRGGSTPPSPQSSSHCWPPTCAPRQDGRPRWRRQPSLWAWCRSPGRVFRSWCRCLL